MFQVQKRQFLTSYPLIELLQIKTFIVLCRKARQRNEEELIETREQYHVDQHLACEYLIKILTKNVVIFWAKIRAIPDMKSCPDSFNNCIRLQLQYFYLLLLINTKTAAMGKPKGSRMCPAARPGSFDAKGSNVPGAVHETRTPGYTLSRWCQLKCICIFLFRYQEIFQTKQFTHQGLHRF